SPGQPRSGPAGCRQKRRRAAAAHVMAKQTDTDTPYDPPLTLTPALRSQVAAIAEALRRECSPRSGRWQVL
ncbi:MAG: hypothetical protein ACK5FE_04850, partial [Cyanobacteriota bacterium]